MRFSSYLRNALGSYQSRLYRLFSYWGFLAWANGGFVRTTFIWRKWHEPTAHYPPVWGHHPQTTALPLCAFEVQLSSRQPRLWTVLCWHFIHRFSASPLTSLYHVKPRHFISLLIVINDGKEKNKTTHSLLNSSQNITLSNLPLVNDNHKEWTKPTDRIKKQHSFLFDLRNLCRAGLRVL